MRTIFSLRFLAALGAVVGLFALLTLAFGGRDPVAELTGSERRIRDVDLVAQVFLPVRVGFEMAPDGTTRGQLNAVLDGDRTARIVEGTYGEITCEDLDTTGACVILADLLGDAVVWFALVPMAPGRTVELPAIDVLDGDRAQLVNGWRLRYATVLDRRCDREFGSYREMRAEIGTAFRSIYSLEDDEIIAVVCED